MLSLSHKKTTQISVTEEKQKQITASGDYEAINYTKSLNPNYVMSLSNDLLFLL
jgi:hypothetical protein